MNGTQETRRVGYLLKTFPKLSETFILNEIVQLEKLGVPLHLFSLRTPMFADKFHPAAYEVQANVTNLFDKFYVGAMSTGNATPLNTNTPFVQIGAPRTISGTVNFGF